MERIIYFKILNNQLIIDDDVKYSNNYDLAFSFNDFKNKINDIQNRLNSLLLEYNINSCVIYINLFKELSELLNKCSSITELKINSNLIIDKNIFQNSVFNNINEYNSLKFSLLISFFFNIYL